MTTLRSLHVDIELWYMFAVVVPWYSPRFGCQRSWVRTLCGDLDFDEMAIIECKKITWASWQKITSLACTACWSSGMILA